MRLSELWMKVDRVILGQKPPKRAQECLMDDCSMPSVPQGGPFCAIHDWSDMPMHAESVAADKARKQREQDLADLERILDAAEELSSAAAYKLARAAGSNHPCQVGGCALSQEEHHRLAYGFMNENRELRRQVLSQNQGGMDGS